MSLTIFPSEIGHPSGLSVGVNATVFPPQNSVPPIPSTADMFACWSTFGITEAYQINGSFPIAAKGKFVANIPTTGISPFPLDWSQVIPNTGLNPKVQKWEGQVGTGDVNSVNQDDDPSFRPAVNVTDKRFDFDGTDDYLYRANLVSGDVATVTWYAIFRTGTFGAIRPLFASKFDADYGAIGQIPIGYIDATGGFVSSQLGTSPLDRNAKRIQLAQNTTYILSNVYDRTQGTAANQTLLLVNNSATEATSPDTADMASSNLNLSTFNFAIGHAVISAAPQYFNGSVMHLQFHNTAHDEATRNAWYARLLYMKEYAGW